MAIRLKMSNQDNKYNTCSNQNTKAAQGAKNSFQILVKKTRTGQRKDFSIAQNLL